MAQPIVISSDDSEDSNEEVSRKCDIIIVENSDSLVRLVIVAGPYKLNLVAL